MSIHFQVLGAPGRDNAALVRVESGRAVARLLFDCGEACLRDLPLSEVQAIDHLLFSHLHMDHVGGFDTFFRATFARADRINAIWGPPRTAEIMHHRFQGFMWNLVEGQPAAWDVHDIHPGEIRAWRYTLADAFAGALPLGARPADGPIIAAPDFTVEALLMDHRTPSVAYVVRERPRHNVDVARLDALSLRPGAWIQRLKSPDSGAVEIGGQSHDLAALRAALLTETPGHSLAYLTDFLLDDAARELLLPALRGCDTIICESQYRHADLALAQRHHHMTTAQAAGLARDAGAGQLVLFHLSDRYRAPDWRAMLDEARAIFPATRFPEQWNLEGGGV